MSEANLPTPYQIARIAAVLQGANPDGTPQEAAQKALELWAASADAIRAEAQRRASGTIRESKGSEADDPLTDDCEITLSKALEFLERLYPNTKPRLRIKRYKTFQHLWFRFDGFKPSVRARSGRVVAPKITIGRLKQFWEDRMNKFRSAETKGRAHRRQKSTGKNLSNKKSVGQIGKVTGRKA